MMVGCTYTETEIIAEKLIETEILALQKTVII
jgi:hypothetical protein